MKIRDRLVLTWALPRLENEEVDMLLGGLCNKDRILRETDFHFQIVTYNLAVTGVSYRMSIGEN